MPEINIPWPEKGISEGRSNDEQPPLTSREAINVRSIDPTNGRIRGAQRSGMSSYSRDSISNSKVQDIFSVTYDNKNTNYAAVSEITDGATTSVALPNKGNCWQIAVDGQSNIYALDTKSAITKYNSQLAEVWKANVELKDPAGELRTIAVDTSNWIYVGVSTGGDMLKARLYAYEQKENLFVSDAGPTVKAERVWEFDTQGFVEKIEIRDGKLYAAINDTRRGRSWVVVLDQINTAVPIEQKRWDIPYPANDLSVSPKDGAVYTAHEPNTERGRDLQNANTVGSWVDWTPSLLSSFDKRVWGWWDASDLDGDGSNNALYEDGEEVLTWYDKSGNARDWEVNTVPTSTPIEAGPLLAKSFVAGRDVLVFDGVNRSMMSGANPTTASAGTDRASRSLFRSAIPTYSGAQFALFMVVRASAETVQRWLLSQDVSSASPADGTRRGILMNSLPNDGATDNASVGSVRILEDTDSASGASGPGVHPLTLCYGPDDFCMITWVSNGGKGSVQSTVRINGRPADQWASQTTWNSTDATFLGWSRDALSATLTRFRGYVCEMLVLSDWYVPGNTPLDAPTLQGLVTTPDYPTSAWTAVDTATTEVELIEGYLANKWGGGYAVPSGTGNVLKLTSNPTNSETVVIGSVTYTFLNTLGGPPATIPGTGVNVLIGGSLKASLENLRSSINLSGARGVDYSPEAGWNGDPNVYAIGITNYDSTATNLALFIQSKTTSASTIACSETLGAGLWETVETKPSQAGSGTNRGHYPHKYYYLRTNTTYTRGGPPSSKDASGTAPVVVSPYSNLHLFGGMLCKWDPLSASLRWVATSGADGSSANSYGAIGYGCSADADGGVWSVGPRQTTLTVPVTILSANNNSICRFADSNTVTAIPSISATYSITTTAGAANEPVQFKHLRIGVDKYSNGYIPVYNATNADSTAYDPMYSVFVLNKSGTVLHRYREPSGSALMHCVVPDPRIASNIADDLSGTTQALQPRAERMFLAGRVERAALLTFSQQPDNDSIVQIGTFTQSGTEYTQVYQFKTTLNGVPRHEVLIGATLTATIENLKEAINNTSVGTGSYAYNLSSLVLGRVNQNYRCTRSDSTTLLVRRISVDAFASSIASELGAGSDSNAVWSSNGVASSASDFYRNTVHRATIVNGTPDNDSPRTTNVIAVAGNSLKRITYNSGVGASIGGFAAGSQYISSTVLGQRAYLTNGESYLYYDAKTNTAAEYKATSAGQIPQRCKLISNWRNRIILARGADDPQNWHMSAVGDPNNWDQFPPVTLPTQAISGNNARAGRCPDIVNAIIPYSDDLLILGGDRSIWRMTGDPMAGGQIDLISDVDGISFGRAWDKDDSGNLYFFGSRGGLYIMRPGSGMKKISSDSIDSRLRDVDLADYYMRLVWNDNEDTLHLFTMPFGGGGTHVRHFVYEARTGAFFQDEFGSANPQIAGSTKVQPTAAYVLDGDDPDDRTILIGCEDGYVRKWDPLARNDGDIASTSTIDSQVTFGPIRLSEEVEARLTAMNLLLAKEQQGCRLQLFVSDTPDSLGIPVWTGDFAPGRNDWRYLRGRGRYLWIRMRNSLFDTRWAFENLTARIERAGRSRVRYT